VPVADVPSIICLPTSCCHSTLQMRMQSAGRGCGEQYLPGPAKRYKLTLTMPASMSLERRILLKVRRCRLTLSTPR